MFSLNYKFFLINKINPSKIICKKDLKNQSHASLTREFIFIFNVDFTIKYK
jgi:hypothetical protein